MLIGLVGKPSVGKSTFFKAATLAEVEISQRPFTTIKPNHGVGYVKVDCIEKEFNVKCNPQHGFCINGNRFVPVELMDAAGLVKKAKVEEGNFSELVTKQFSGLKIKNDDVKKVLRKINLPEKPVSWNEKQLIKFASELRRESKPTIIAANKVDMKNGKENYERLVKEFPDYKIIPCSADSELALREAAKRELIRYIPGENNFEIYEGKINETQKEALEKIKRNVLDIYGSTGVQEILNEVVFNLLKYIAIFPAGANKLGDSKGNILPDCFLLPQGSTALEFAYFLHTDFGKNFIRAIDARSKKALGKNHELKHRDSLEIVIKK